MSPQLQTLVQHVVNGISLGAIYALIALGYTMVYGILQLINFAHSDVFMVGAYLGYFAGHWIFGAQIPDAPLLTFGIPLGIFLTVLNHRPLSVLFRQPVVAVTDRALLRAAVFGAVSSVIAVALVAAWRGVLAFPNFPETLALGLPTRPVFLGLALVLMAGGPLLILARGLWFPLITGIVITGAVLGTVRFSFPVIARAAQGMQYGAVRALSAGKVTRVTEGRQLRNRVVVADVPQLLAAEDEPLVKPDELVVAGQVVTRSGVKSQLSGTVTAAGRGPVQIKEVLIGEDLITIPGAHAVVVKRDQQLEPGDKISSGIVFGTPVLVLVFAMAGCATLGFLIERIAYRPLRHAPRINSLITAIGMSLLLVNSAQLIFGADPKGFPQIIPTFAPQRIGGVIIDVKQVTVLVVAVFLMMVLQYVVYHTRLGLAMRAVSYNHSWAGLMGVPVDRVVSATFMIGSALAAAAGVLEGVTYKKIDPYLGMLLGLKAFVAAVLGGIGNLPGALLGGLLMGLSEEMVAGYVSSNFRDAIAFLILILILLFRPAGLLGEPTVEKV